MTDKETGGTGEFIRSDGNDLNDQLLVGQVSPGKLDAFSGVALLNIRVSGLGRSPTRSMKRGQGFRSSRFFFTGAS